MPDKPGLHIDLFHYGMVKSSLHDPDPSLLRGVNRVASEYAMRPGLFTDFSRVNCFGSRLPSITAAAYAASGIPFISAPPVPSYRERCLDAINRLERHLRKRPGFSERSRKALAAIRYLARLNLMRDFFTPVVVRPGDIWLSICTHLTPEARALPATRVVVCHDLNHVFHYREMGLGSPSASPLDNNGLGVHKDEWVICVSEYTRKCFLEYHVGFPPDQVFVNSLGSDLGGGVPAQAAGTILNGFGLAPEKYFLSLAAGAQHKNSSYLIEEFIAWLGEDRSRAGIKLALVGAGQNTITSRLSQQAQAGVDAGHVVFTGFLPDEDLPALYGNTLAFVFASLAEGFGLPPLEAMGHGAPVLCSDRTSLPEVVGDAGLLFDPTEPGNLMKLLSQISEDQNLRESLSRKGRLRAAEYTWERSTRGLAEILRRISETESSRLENTAPARNPS